MSRDTRTAAALALGMFVIFNANGREIASYDSQPTKYAARELLLRGTLSLNHVVGKTPELGTRAAFVETANGRYRSAYSPVPAVMAAGITWPFWKLGLIDIRAPRAPSLMAAVASSLLVALAVGVAYLIARKYVSARRAVLVAAGLGAGTGLWSTASQTLWQHETAIFGLTVAVYALVTAGDGRSWWRAALLGVGLGLAASSRLQLAPAVLMLLAGSVVVAGWRRALLTMSVAAALVLPVLAANYFWFGTILGAAPMLEALHDTVHGKSVSFALQLEGFQGLLVSPNRGLVIFSPVVLVGVLGLPRSVRAGFTSPLPWLVLAAGAQFLLYALYAVWWGGHTYGPRYMLDLLPLLVPAAAIGVDSLRGRLPALLATAALSWSVGVATVGAYNHPNGRWNNDPVDVDRAHERLWDWSDNQIRRTWQAGPSPQNFSLLTRDALREPRP